MAGTPWSDTAEGEARGGTAPPRAATMKKPSPLNLNRNLRSLEDMPAAKITSWQLGRYECGTAIEIEGLAFDEGDAAEIRRLAAWLTQAAKWLEAKVRVKA